MLANDLNVLTGRAPASSFLTISSGVSDTAGAEVLAGCLCCSGTRDGSAGVGAENETDILDFFSGSAELAIVREMMSNAENLDGGGCLGVVVSSCGDEWFLAGLSGLGNIGYDVRWVFGSGSFCFAGLPVSDSSTCIRPPVSSAGLARAAGFGDALRERCGKS